MIYDLAIIGGGPAGISAGVYASRKKIKTIFIAKDFGGQSIVSEGIENWIGTPKISGIDLAKSMEKHLKTYAEENVTIKEGELCLKISKEKNGFTITTDKEEYEAKTVLIASGSHRRKLDIPGADKFEHKGITYCASCDGPMFDGKDVVIIGGGNAAFESASQLLAYCKSVTLLQRSAEYRADPITVQKVLSNPRMKGITNISLQEIRGDKFVKTLVYKNSETGERVEMPVDGIFVEIGNVPSVDFAKTLVKMTRTNQITVDPKNQRTSVEGIWSAGDCTDALYHQNNIASGDGVKALEDIYLFLHAGK